MFLHFVVGLHFIKKEAELGSLERDLASLQNALESPEVVSQILLACNFQKPCKEHSIIYNLFLT